MQSLGRKIVNFLGMTTLGQKTSSNSLSVVPAFDFLGPRTSSSSLSVTFASDAIPPGFVARSGFAGCNWVGPSTSLSEALDSELGVGLWSGVVEFYINRAIVNFTRPDSLPTIKRFFDGTDTEFTADPIYVIIPFAEFGLTNISILAKHTLTSGGSPINLGILAQGVIGGRNLFNISSPLTENYAETLFTEANGCRKSVVLGGGYDHILLTVTPSANPNAGKWTLLVGGNNL